MIMRVLVMFLVFLGLLLGGLILASFRSAEALQIELPKIFPRGDDIEMLDVSKVRRSITETDMMDMNEQRIEEYIKYLQGQGKQGSSKPSLSEKPSDEVREFTHKLLQGIAKRTSFATSTEEFETLRNSERNLNNEYLTNPGIGQMRKRNQQKETHAGGCEAAVDWISLSRHHFPRFIKSYNCTSTGCRNGGECRRKRYPVYVLRMNSPDNISVQDEGCDTNLPMELRCDWKLIQINVTTYCECNSEGVDPFIFGR